MADTRSPEQRRRIMQAVQQRDTGPEVFVRKLLHADGYRFRLQARELPGKPDIVMRPRRKAIFVHGCFWHGHRCEKGRLPRSKLDYWGPKLEQNIARDRRNLRALRKSGWDVLIVWQCELHRPEQLLKRLKAFVERSKKTIDK